MLMKHLFFRNTLPILLACLFLPAPARTQSIFDSLRVAHREQVFFAFGKYELNADAQVALDSFTAAWSRLNPAVRIRITAHTDSVGSGANNLALSQRRAAAVQAALLGRGLPAERMDLVYFGEARPTASNGTEDGRQRNRRATLEAFTAVPMAPYSGQVQDKKSGEGIPATVHFSTRTLRDSILTDPTGFYAVRLPRDSVVKIEAYARDYFFESVMQRIYGTPEMIRRMQSQPAVLQLVPAKVGETAVLNNMFFVSNEATLLKSSEPELPKVLRFMQINPAIRIEIAGHINHPYWQKIPFPDPTLSERRARLVYEYLLRNGIPEERMSFKGYQNTQMLFPETHDADEMEQNRRVEIRVVE